MLNFAQIKEKCYQMCTSALSDETGTDKKIKLYSQKANTTDHSRISSAQGAIEYLLLLAAAIIVVTIVVTFMISAIEPVKTSGGQGTYGYICDTLNSQTEDCGCYYGPTGDNGTTGNFGSTAAICCCKNDSLLTNNWNCSAVTCPQG